MNLVNWSKLGIPQVICVFQRDLRSLKKTLNLTLSLFSPSNGSPNSSLLDICTEQCACCNAIVIDYCANDMQDPNSIPVSKSCPPFSNISQHMVHSPRSPVCLKCGSFLESLMFRFVQTTDKSFQE